MNINYQLDGSPFDAALSLAISIPLLFGPQFLLSIFSTLNFRDKSSLKILYRQPSLIILPTVTYFTFSRQNIICCNENNRVSFSKKFTWLNIAVSTVGYVVWWYYIVLPYTYLDEGLFFAIVLIFTLPLLVPSILLTALFLHLDKLCCCCNPREQLSVYDPDLDKRFIMVDGEVVEDPEEDVETPEDDVETDTKTCCGGWFNSIVPDTEGTAKGEETEMTEIVPDFMGEERLSIEGGEVTESSVMI